MMKSYVITLIILLFSYGTIHTQEQERPTPPPRETRIPETDRIEREEPQRDRLPEFELPEYVITGRATFRLPYVHKQKISEQNIFIAEVSETMKGVDRDIQTSPIDPPTKSFGEFRKIPSMQYGQVRLGYGRFNTPTFSGWANYRSGQWDASARLSYLNTEGHEPFAEGYDLDGRFQFGYRFPHEAPVFVRGGRPYLTIGFEGLKYGLHTWIMDPTLLPVPIDFQYGLRKFRTGYSEIGFQSGADAPFDFDFLLGWRGSTLENESAPTIQLNDDELYTRLRTLGYIQSVRFRSTIEYITNNIDVDSDNEIQNPQYFRGTAAALFPVIEDFITLELGGSLYSVRSTHSDNQSSVKPLVELRAMPAHSFTVYGRYAPEVVHRSLYSLQQFNRYIGWWAITPQSITIMPTEDRINATAGIEFIPRRQLQIHAFTQYREMKAYPGILGLDTEGTFELTYLGLTKIFSVNANVQYAFSNQDILTMQTSLRYSKNDFYDLSVPDIAPVEIAAVYTREFLPGLRASAGLELLSPRRAAYEVGDSDSLGNLINLNLDVQYQFHNIMGVYVKFDNILNQTYERYYRYRTRPFYIEGGIQLSF